MIDVQTHGDGRSVKTSDVIAKEHIAVAIPFREIDTMESIACGFRMDMIHTEDGHVGTGAGLGNDFIHVEWRGRKAVIRGSDLLAAWARIVSPDDLKRFPDDVRLTDDTGKEHA